MRLVILVSMILECFIGILISVLCIRLKALIICKVSDTGLYDFGWFCWDPDFSIGHITTDLSSGTMSPLSSECFHSMYT